LGVLDVGSNTVHLLVVDAYRGAQPTPQLSQKSELRLAESIGAKGGLSRHAADALVEAVADAKHDAKKLGCDELMAFATSAVRDARNAAEVLGRVVKETGVELSVLSGDDEARLTFLAVRRWLGWSAGNLMSLDIGGGSLELAAGCDEEPAVAVSLPLGAARLTRDWFDDDPPDKQSVAALRAHVAALLDKPARALLDTGAPDRVVATSKTFRTLARLAGAAPSSAGLRASRKLSGTGLGQLVEFVSRIESAALAELPGVSANRAHQVPAGAVVAAATMRALDVRFVRICPWALREGVILRRLDSLGGV
jgi:exopolyphosphatase/guanosine-5'-triphosphate,3'-diphosphate pyrophosphatase